MTVRLVTWNPHAGSGDRLPDVLPRMLKAAGDPDIVSLQEVWDWQGTIPGYRRIAAPAADFPHREARSTVLLLKRRRGIRLLGKSFRQVDGPDWYGPHGDRHPPRVYPRLAASVDGDAVEVIGVHRTWVNPNTSPRREANLRSWRAEHRELVRWSARRHRRAPGRALVLWGDHNGRRLDEGRHGVDWSLPQLADDLCGYLALRGIDGGVVRAADTRHLDKLDRSYGSDHHPVVMDLYP